MCLITLIKFNETDFGDTFNWKSDWAINGSTDGRQAVQIVDQRWTAVT